MLTRTDNKAISSPFVEVEIIGADFDCQKIRTTKYIGDLRLSKHFVLFFKIHYLRVKQLTGFVYDVFS